MRAEFLGGDAGGESAFGDFDFVLRFVFENLLEHLDDVLLVIDDEDARLQPVIRPLSGMPCCFMKRMSWLSGMRRSLQPGMR